MTALSKERARHTRTLNTMPLLATYKGDGPRTLALIAEIEAWINARPEGVEIEHWEDDIHAKIPRWRAKLRAARYMDWQAARKSGT